MDRDKVAEIEAMIQELKLQAWKGGYLSGLGRKEKAWKMRPVMNKQILKIRRKLQNY